MWRETAAQLASVWAATSGIEMLAAVLAVAYLVFAIRQSLWCWVWAFISSCLYVWVLFGARLYMESCLNGFYAVMAAYGYWQWRGRRGGGLAVQHWRWPAQLAGVAAVLALSACSSFLLRRYTAAAWPWLDSLVAWSSVVATYLVARKVYENWYWWLLIDSVSAVLYLTRRLYLTTLLFVLYLVLIVVGMREWRRHASAPVHA